MNKKILIISGDPNSINSELIYKSWKKINLKIKKDIILISNYNLIKKQLKILKCNIKLKKVKNIHEKSNKNELKIIDVSLNFKSPFSVKKKYASHFVIKTLNMAHSLAKDDQIKGLINCPINKNLLNKKNIGVTEYLASKNGIKNNSEVMLIRNNKLSVCPITTHINIKDVPKKLNKRMIINKIKTIDSWFVKSFKKKPLIAIMGLNPHNAEYRQNSEEKKVIIPAISFIKKIGIKINGPHASDTLFIDKYKKFDVIIGMYHDQILSPFKSIFKFDAVNLTLGLKYLRLSPDHGIGNDIIKKNKANPTSLIQCINFLYKIKK